LHGDHPLDLHGTIKLPNDFVVEEATTTTTSQYFVKVQLYAKKQIQHLQCVHFQCLIYAILIFQLIIVQ